MKIKNTFILYVLLIFVLSACGNNSPVNTPETITLKINSSTLTSYAPIFIAESEGYFADAGIQMDYTKFNRTTEAVPLIITGDLDIYAGSLNTGLLNILGQEDNVKVVADRGHVASDDSCAYIGIMFRKDLYDSGEFTRPADLAGRTIAPSKNGPSGYLISLYLARAGLTFDDVTITDLPTSSYIDAMVNGTLDAVSTPELNVSRLLNSGNAVLGVNGATEYGSLQTSVLVFGKNLLVDNREAGIRFLTAYLRGVQQYNEGKTDRNVEIMVENTGESAETLRSACWVTINSDGSIDFDASVSKYQQWNIEQRYLDSPVTEEQFWDPSLLENALARLNQ